MFPTDQATAASSLPTPAAAGTQGFFTNGNPASGVAATILDADFLNMIQQELLNVVLAGGLTPSKTTYTQVRDAIRSMRGTMQGVTGAGTTTTFSATQVAGCEIVFFGSTAAQTLTLPTRASVIALAPFSCTNIVNLGTVPVTIATSSGDTFFNPLNNTATSVVIQPGDDLELVTNGSGNVWTMMGGSALRQYQPLAVVGLSGAGAVGIVGSVRNLAMNVATASASANLTADEIVVESTLGGTAYKLASFSKTINLATTGAGGMDTGTAPVSGFVALYAIYNPTTQTAALLATNAATKQGNVYGGANMPAGYTASALVSVWPTNASSQFQAAYQSDRYVTIQGANPLTTTTTAASPTAVSLASFVPANAKTVSGYEQIGSSGTNANSSGSVFPSSVGFGGQPISIQLAPANLTVQVPFTACQMLTPQTIYYTCNTTSGSFTYAIFVNSYTF